MDYESLVNRIRNKDEEAIAEFYHEFYRDIYYVCLKITENEKDAEDISQEVLFRAIDKIELLHSPSGLPAWLRTIANNLSINYIKKNRKFDIVDMAGNDEEDIFAEKASNEKTPEDVVADKEVSKILLSMIDKLPSEQRITIFMFYFEEMSVRDISEVMDCSEATVRSRINYARKNLRKQVEELEDKGIKLRCVAILPFLGAVYSFEKTTVGTQIALPEVYAAANNGMANMTDNANVDMSQSGNNDIVRDKMGKEILKMNKKSGMGVGAKVAIGAAAAVVAVGAVIGSVFLLNKGDDNKQTSTNSGTNVGIDGGSSEDGLPVVDMKEYKGRKSFSYSDGKLTRGDISVLYDYTGYWDTIKYVRFINGKGYVCYIDKDTKHLICENPVTKEKTLDIDLSEYEISEVGYGRAYITMELRKGEDNPRRVAYNLYTGEKVVDIDLWDTDEKIVNMCSSGETLIVAYRSSKEHVWLSYTVYDKDGNATNPCPEELLNNIYFIDRNYIEVNTEDGSVKKYYSNETMEQILPEVKRMGGVAGNYKVTLAQDMGTEEYYLLTEKEQYKLSDYSFVRHNSRQNGEYLYAVIFVDREGKRRFYSFEEYTYLEIGDHFTDDFIINSSHTAMAYVGDDGNYYYYDIANNKEIQLDITSGAYLIAVTDGKVVYMQDSQAVCTFTSLEVDSNKKTELCSAGNKVETEYKIYVEGGYDDTSFRTRICCDVYDEAIGDWCYGYDTEVENDY